ncbi:MAG: hypothetical protein QOH06_3367 [Acidobacteriota bacterium]|jgi:hypothetical protein|nr:hypothetical protein [Acidobacteriota bacterium]
MPDISSFADFLADWDLLLKGVANKNGSLPDLSGLTMPLEEILEEGRDQEADKAAARAQLSQGSKRTRALVTDGRAAASRLRSALKAHYGGHNEVLVEFGIAPLRKRRTTLPTDPPPPNPPIAPLPE